MDPLQYFGLACLCAVIVFCVAKYIASVLCETFICGPCKQLLCLPCRCICNMANRDTSSDKELLNIEHNQIQRGI